MVLGLCTPQAAAGVSGSSPDFGRKSFNDTLKNIEAGLCDGARVHRLLANEASAEFFARYAMNETSLDAWGAATEKEFIDAVGISMSGHVPGAAAEFAACETHADVLPCGETVPLMAAHPAFLVEPGEDVSPQRLADTMAAMDIRKCARITWSATLKDSGPARALFVAGDAGGAAQVFFLGPDHGALAGMERPRPPRVGPDRSGAGDYITGAPTIEARGDQLCRAGLDGDAAALIDLMPPQLIESMVEMMIQFDETLSESQYPVWEMKQQMIEQMDLEGMQLLSCSVVKTRTLDCTQDDYTMFDTMEIQVDACGEIRIKSQEEGKEQKEDLLKAVQIEGRWYIGGE